MKAEDITCQPLQPVSINGSSHLFLGNCQTEAGGCVVFVVNGEDGKEGVGRTTRFCEDTVVLRGNGETCRLRKARV